MQVTSAYGWISGPSGYSLSWFLYHEITGSICTFPGWDATCSPSQGYPCTIKFTGIHLYTWVERGTVRSVLAKNTTQCPGPELEPGPLDMETRTLTMRPTHLPKVNLNLWKSCRSLLNPPSKTTVYVYMYICCCQPDTRESWSQCLCPPPPLPQTINQKVSNPGKFWKYLEDFQLSCNQVLVY